MRNVASAQRVYSPRVIARRRTFIVGGVLMSSLGALNALLHAFGVSRTLLQIADLAAVAGALAGFALIILSTRERPSTQPNADPEVRI
jgi:presenilin-like A22 family membrane protease